MLCLGTSLTFRNCLIPTVTERPVPTDTRRAAETWAKAALQTRALIAPGGDPATSQKPDAVSARAPYDAHAHGSGVAVPL